MLLYFDLDSKQLINGPGFSGIVKSLSFVRGDHETLEVRFLRADAAVTDVTNIVFVIKEIPGTESPALAIANTWENPEGEEYFTSPLSLNTEALDTLLGSTRSKSLLAEITCHQGGTGPITSQLVTANVTGDLWRGDETTPEELPTPDAEWVAHGHAQTLTTEQKTQARENIGLVTLLRTTAQGVPVVEVVGFDFTYEDAPSYDGTYTHAGDLLNGDRVFLPATSAVVLSGGILSGAGAAWIYGEYGWNFFTSDEWENNGVSPDVLITAADAEANPADVTYWYFGIATSDIAFTEIVVAGGGEFIGQECRVGDEPGPFDWYRWDGIAWESIDIPDPQSLTSSKSVANAAARLALTLEEAQGFCVVEADTGKSYMLAAGATDPSVEGNWLQVGDREITIPDVSGLQTALDGKADAGSSASPAPLSPVTSIELAAHQTKTATNQQLTIWTLGDSMMSDTRLPYGLNWILQYKTPIIGYALESILTKVVSGTVVEPPANATGSQRQDLWDTGKVWQMSSGAIIRAINSNGSTVGLYGSKANFYCLKQSGGGTATIEYSRDGGSTWASLGTLDTNGTAGELARAALTPAASLGHYIYRVTATGGPVNYIGCKVWDDTRSGVILCNSNMGGITINSTLSAPAAVRNTIAADLGKIILISQFREGTGELTDTILGNFLDAWETAIPNGEIVLVDQCDTPSLTGNEFTASVNAWYRTQAAARTRVRVYDINAAMGSEAERDARGFYNTSARGTVTVNTTTNVLTCSAAHSFSVGGEITFSTTGTLPAPLQPWTMDNPKRYFVKTTPTSTTFTISETNGGAEVDLTDSGSGTHTVWQTDTIHMSDDAWRFVGADIAMKLINFANGTCPSPVFRNGAGAREVMFGGLAEEYAPSDYTFRMPRAGRGRWGVNSKTNLGGIYRMGFFCQTHNATFADGVIFELANDGGYKTPFTIDGSGYSYWGPYAATTNSGYTIGARAVVEEDANGKSVIAGFHKGNAPTVPLMRLGMNASGTRTDKFQVWGDGKVSEFPPASATPATNGELVVEATSNTTLTFKLKGSDGTVRTGTITLA